MNAGDRAERAVADGLELVDAVRRWDRRDIANVIRNGDLPALVVALAAMVDQDRTPRDILGWVEERPDQHDGWALTDVLAAHSQYELCRTRGVEIPDDVREGQRVYDRVRARQRRATQKALAS